MNADALLINEFLLKSKNELLIDVRAPVEFLKGHIPGAINIPLFENSERVEIGTLFKQQGKDSAVSRGMEIVSPKMSSFVKQVTELTKNKKVFVYCFRGGMRSNSFAWLMNNSGLDALILKDGYKVYRNHVLESFSEKKSLVLIGGKTGSGKTEILKELKRKSYQVIDLEHLAHHKGSAFGSINEQKQDAQQIFENNLFNTFNQLDKSRTIVLEDESKNIGFNKLPHELWLQMKQASIIKIEIPFELRVQKLVDDYTTSDIPSLKNCVIKIAQQLGTLNTKLCLQYLEENNLADVARLSLLYYDKAYEFIYDHKTQPVFHFSSDTIDAEINVQKVKEIIDSLK